MNLGDLLKTAGGEIASGVKAELRQGVRGVLRSNWLPDIPINLAAGGGGGSSGAPAPSSGGKSTPKESAGKAAARVLKPWLHLDLPGGVPAVDWSPGGRPGPSRWPLVVAGVAVVVALAAVGAWTVGRAIAK